MTVEDKKLDSASMIGERLKELREMASLTRELLAEKAGVGVSSVVYWENGRSNPMSIKSMGKILDALRGCGVECHHEWLRNGKGVGPRLISESEFLETSTSSRFSLPAGIQGLAPALEAQINEIKIFAQSSRLAVVVKVENNAMQPVYERGDIVGGYWESSNTLTTAKICIVQIAGKIEVRQVEPTQETGLFNLSYLTTDPSVVDHNRMESVLLDKVAPIIRLWR